VYSNNAVVVYLLQHFQFARKTKKYKFLYQYVADSMSHLQNETRCCKFLGPKSKRFAEVQASLNINGQPLWRNYSYNCEQTMMPNAIFILW